MNKHIFNFESRFAPLIIAGDKSSTIRPIRKRMPKRGDIACLYTGLRTKDSDLLLQSKIIRVKVFPKKDICTATDDFVRIVKTEGFEVDLQLRAFFMSKYPKMKNKWSPWRGAFNINFDGFFLTEWELPPY